MKIVVTNAVTLNGGDAAILTAVHGLLSEAFPGAEICAVDSQASVAARLYPELRFEQHLYDGTRGRRFVSARRRAIRKAAARMARGDSAGVSLLLSPHARRTLSTYASADLVVSTGGTYLVEHYELGHRIFELEVAAGFGAPLVFFTQSLGPFRRPENVASMRKLFERASLVLLRDARSERHLAEIGVPERLLAVHGDAAFALAGDASAKRLRSERLPEKGARVAVSVRHWSHFSGGSADQAMARYRAAMARVVEHLVRDRACDVTFVSTCQGIAEYWTDDAKTATEIVSLLPGDVRASVHVDSGFHRPLELVEIFRRTDLVIATRMHAAILALVAGTPVLPIAYESKTTELFAALGARDLVLEMESMTPDAALSACRTFYEELEARREAIAGGVEAQRASARAVIARLRELVPRERRPA